MRSLEKELLSISCTLLSPAVLERFPFKHLLSYLIQLTLLLKFWYAYFFKGKINSYSDRNHQIGWHSRFFNILTCSEAIRKNLVHAAFFGNSGRIDNLSGYNEYFEHFLSGISLLCYLPHEISGI